MAPKQRICELSEERHVEMKVQEGEKTVITPYKRSHETTSDGEKCNVVIYLSVFSIIESLDQKENYPLNEKRNTLFFLEEDHRKMSTQKFNNDESKLTSRYNYENSFGKNVKCDNISPNQDLEKKLDDTQGQGSVRLCHFCTCE